MNIMIYVVVKYMYVDGIFGIVIKVGYVMILTKKTILENTVINTPKASTNI